MKRNLDKITALAAIVMTLASCGIEVGNPNEGEKQPVSIPELFSIEALSGVLARDVNLNLSEPQRLELATVLLYGYSLGVPKGNDSMATSDGWAGDTAYCNYSDPKTASPFSELSRYRSKSLSKRLRIRVMAR